jgi:hypothetical protein
LSSRRGFFSTVIRCSFSTLGYLSPADFENRILVTDGASLAASRLAPTDRKIIQTTSDAQDA